MSLHKRDKNGVLHKIAGALTVDSVLSDSSTNAIMNKAVKKEVDDLRDELDAIDSANAGNLIIYPYNSASYSDNSGLHYEVNQDHSITVNGTSTGTSYFFINHRINKPQLKLKKGTYVLTGCPEGGSEETYALFANHTVDGQSERFGADCGEGFEFTITDDEDNIGIFIDIKPGTTVDNLNFKPMVCFKGTSLTDYESPSIRNYPYISKSDVVNMFPFPYADGYSKTVNGFTFTVNADKSITINGVSQNTSINSIFYLATGKDWKKGIDFNIPRLITGVIGNYGDTTDVVYVYSDGRVSNNPYENYTWSDNSVSGDAYVYVPSGITSVSNKTVYPMYRYADNEDNTYVQPGVKSNALLTDDVSAIYSQLQPGKNYFRIDTDPQSDFPYTLGNMKIFIDTDGIITANGSNPNSSTSGLYVWGRTGANYHVKNEYVGMRLSLTTNPTPTRSSSTTSKFALKVDYYASASSTSVVTSDLVYEDESIVIQDYPYFAVLVSAGSGMTCNNTKLYPVLCRPELDDSFTPYLMNIDAADGFSWIRNRTVGSNTTILTQLSKCNLARPFRARILVQSSYVIANATTHEQTFVRKLLLLQNMAYEDWYNSSNSFYLDVVNFGFNNDSNRMGSLLLSVNSAFAIGRFTIGSIGGDATFLEVPRFIGDPYYYKTFSLADFVADSTKALDTIPYLGYANRVECYIYEKTGGWTVGHSYRTRINMGSFFSSSDPNKMAVILDEGIAYDSDPKKNQIRLGLVMNQTKTGYPQWSTGQFYIRIGSNVTCMQSGNRTPSLQVYIYP